jgi:adenylosuccinate lyase
LIERYQSESIENIWNSKAKASVWLEVELAICQAHETCGTIPKGTTEKLRKTATFDISRMAELEKETRHDLMAFVRNVSETVGEDGRWIHYGVTSYDVIDTSLAMMLRRSLEVVRDSLSDLQTVVSRRALEFIDTPMIGRTHGVHAEPITFGFKLAGWFAELKRADARLSDCIDEISVGKISGPVGIYGVVTPAVELEVCKILDLRPDPASTQIISRDRHAHVLAVLSVLGGTLERSATELRNLQRTEILEVQTGSSAMPHKRNPWQSETICGLARVLRGHALAMLESVSTWHERDLTNSSVERIVLPDSFHLVDFMLKRLTMILDRLVVFPDKMFSNLQLMGDLVFSEHLMSALVEKGLPREQAYKIAQRNAERAWKGESYRDCIYQDAEVQSKLSKDELDTIFNLEHHLRHARKALVSVGILDSAAPS